MLNHLENEFGTIRVPLSSGVTPGGAMGRGFSPPSKKILDFY